MHPLNSHFCHRTEPETGFLGGSGELAASAVGYLWFSGELKCGRSVGGWAHGLGITASHQVRDQRQQEEPALRAGGAGGLVECLPSSQEALGSSPAPNKT